MSEKPEITTAFIQEISKLLTEDNANELQRILADLHMADIAEILEDISLEDARKLYGLIDEEKSAEILVNSKKMIRNAPK